MFKNNQLTKKCQIMMERRLNFSIAKKRMNLYEIKELLYRPPFNSFLHFENEEQTLSTIITIKFSKKGLYKGEINDNFLPDGKGILFLENGDIYYGDFNNGIKEGKKFQTLLGVTGSRKNLYHGKYNSKSTISYTLLNRLCYNNNIENISKYINS